MALKLWCGIIILGLLLSGCTIQAPGATGGGETKYVCSDSTVVTAPELCPAAATVARNLTRDEQLSVCTDMPELQGTSLEDVCMMGLAAKTGDTSICQKLSTDRRGSCYALVADTKNDVNVCLGAGAYKDSCYEEYARARQDASACDKITDVNKRDNCYLNIFNMLGDAAICDKITSSWQKNSCYMNAASRTRDASYCDKITDANQKENCLQNIQGQSQSPAKP